MSGAVLLQRRPIHRLPRASIRNRVARIRRRSAPSEDCFQTARPDAVYSELFLRSRQLYGFYGRQCYSFKAELAQTRVSHCDIWVPTEMLYSGESVAASLSPAAFVLITKSPRLYCCCGAFVAAKIWRKLVFSEVPYCF